MTNLARAAGTYALSVSCTGLGISACTVPSSIALDSAGVAAGTGPATVTYNTAGPELTGTITLTASYGAPRSTSGR